MRVDPDRARMYDEVPLWRLFLAAVLWTVNAIVWIRLGAWLGAFFR